jgi:eukaryotic-like serine/threonine-protein kinase
VIGGVYAGVRWQAVRRRNDQIAETLAKAKPELALARKQRDEGLAQRALAYAAYDAGKRDEAEVVWEGAREALRVAEASYASAHSALESAYFLDLDNADVRHALAVTIAERQALAEAQSNYDAAQALARTLKLYDPASANRPVAATLVVDVQPPGDVNVERYNDRGLERIAVPQAARRSPFTTELPPGSYRLRFGNVSYPVLLAPREKLRVAFALPARVPEGFVYIPAGRFLYGFRGDEDLRRGWFGAEPEHAVTTGAYLIARTEVTIAQWLEFLDALPPAERAVHRARVTWPRRSPAMARCWCSTRSAAGAGLRSG